VTTGDEFGAFYAQLREIRDYHRNHYGEVARTPVVPFAVARDDAGNLLEPAVLPVPFSGEEGAGRYLDLHALHADYANLKGVTPIPYLQYLGQCTRFANFPLATKQTGAYRKCVPLLLNAFFYTFLSAPHACARSPWSFRPLTATPCPSNPFRYVADLVEYLTGFFRRARPLVNVEASVAAAAAAFEAAWANSAVAGWPGACVLGVLGTFRQKKIGSLTWCVKMQLVGIWLLPLLYLAQKWTWMPMKVQPRWKPLGSRL
jgi:hypothetical protein